MPFAICHLVGLLLVPHESDVEEESFDRAHIAADVDPVRSLGILRRTNEADAYTKTMGISTLVTC
jgi:hypothetical protein